MLEIIYAPSFLRHLRNAEHFGLYENIMLHIGDKEMKPVALVPVKNSFLAAFDREDRVYKRAARREETARIKEAHEKSKTSYMAVKRLFEAASYSETPDVKAAAASLLLMLENYKQAYYAPMNEAAALFVNLLQDLEADRYAGKVALIAGAQEAAAHLKRDNDVFINLFANRTFAEEEEKVEGTMAEARKVVDEKFAELADSINAFYHANEMLPQKDPEVSALLSDIIMFINSFIHKYEAIYSRRNPKYHAGGGTPSSPDGEHPSGGGDEPAPGVPQLAIAAQETLGESPAMPGFGVQMSLRAADIAAFAAALYPGAQNGLLRLTRTGTENGEDFPIAGFLMEADGSTPAGLLVDAPDIYTFFIKPFNGTDPAEAAVYKDGELLATLTGVLFPATISEG
jgi:hypothetical protein